MIFPDTLPCAATLVPLVPVFAPVVYCRPAENEERDSDFDAGLASLNTSSGSAYELYVPAPLGPERDRFARLVRDLRTRGDNYAGQLTHLSLAGIGHYPGREQSSGSILSQLLHGQGIREQNDEKRALILWQARLVLELAEMFDREQEDLNRQLESIGARQQELLADLREEADATFDLTEKLAAPAITDNRLQPLRLKAWARLFAAGSEDVDALPRIYLTKDNDALEQLKDTFEKNSGTPPRKVLRMPLPARTPATDLRRTAEAAADFSRKAAPLIKTLADTLLGSGANREMEQETKSPEWEALLDDCFPESDYGRCALTLYSFPDCNVRQLFLDSFGSSKEFPLPDNAGSGKMPIVIGVLADCL